MKKISSLFLVLAFIYGLSANIIPVPAEAYYPCNLSYPGQLGNCEGCQTLTPSECHANCTENFYGYSCYNYLQQKQKGGAVFGPSPTPPTTIPCATPVYGMPSVSVNYPCSCPNGTTVTNTSSYATCYGLLICSDGSVAPYQNYCPQQTYTCWDGTTAQNEYSCPSYKYCSNDSYTKRPLSYTCPDMYIQNCQPSIPGTYYTLDARQCKCPDGATVWGNGAGYTSQCNWNTPVCNGVYPNYCTGLLIDCWDGSKAVNQNSCPSYKYCPNDYIKRSLSYQCPTQTKTCSDGTVIPLYQTCPSSYSCNYSQYWNGYNCIDTYSPYQQTYIYPRDTWYDWNYTDTIQQWGSNYSW